MLRRVRRAWCRVGWNGCATQCASGSSKEGADQRSGYQVERDPGSCQERRRAYAGSEDQPQGCPGSEWVVLVRGSRERSLTEGPWRGSKKQSGSRLGSGSPDSGVQASQGVPAFVQCTECPLVIPATEQRQTADCSEFPRCLLIGIQRSPVVGHRIRVGAGTPRNEGVGGQQLPEGCDLLVQASDLISPVSSAPASLTLPQHLCPRHRLLPFCQGRQAGESVAHIRLSGTDRPRTPRRPPRRQQATASASKWSGNSEQPRACPLTMPAAPGNSRVPDGVGLRTKGPTARWSVPSWSSGSGGAPGGRGVGGQAAVSLRVCCSASRSDSIREMRARATRERTVPMGQLLNSAASA